MSFSEKYINLRNSHKFIFLLLVSFFIVMVFGNAYESDKKSLVVFLDPGNYSDISDDYPVLGLVEVIIGVIVFGSLISLIINAIEEKVKYYIVAENRKTIKEAFEVNPLIRTRALLKSLDINAEARYIRLKDVECKLDIDFSDIKQVVRSFNDIRMRNLNDEFIIESFLINTNYGCFINNDSDITIISTQSFSDISIGHFSRTLASNMHANYLSNEFFSSGALKKKNRENFSKNDSFLTMKNNQKKINHIDSFIEDIKQSSLRTKLYMYLTTCNHTREHDVYILFGNPVNDVVFSDKSTIKENNFNVIVNSLKESFSDKNLTLGFNDEFSNSSPNGLSRALYDNFNIETIYIAISTRVLTEKEQIVYYVVMDAIRKAIRSLHNNKTYKL